MAKYSFRNYGSVTYTLDFCDGFALVVVLSDDDARKTKTKRYEFKTACGLANAELALCEENPQSRTNGYWCDNRLKSRERRADYCRAYENASGALPF